MRPAAAGTRGFPRVVALHDHGAFKYYGKEKLVGDTRRARPSCASSSTKTYGGVSWANELARRGFVVVVPDNFLWGSRKIPIDSVAGGVRGQREADPEGTRAYIEAYNEFSSDYESLVAKTLFLSGATWTGIMAWEDRRAVDYLLTRADTDPSRLGCGGLSGGGLRTIYLAALDPRVNCAVCAGFMSTVGEMIPDVVRRHTWMFHVPHLAALMDLPDVASLHGPVPLMVQGDRDDELWTLDRPGAGGSAACPDLRAHGRCPRPTGPVLPRAAQVRPAHAERRIRLVPEVAVMTGDKMLYKDPDKPRGARVADLLGRMTLEEKVSQMVHGAAEIPRLDVPGVRLVERGPSRRGTRGRRHGLPAGDRPRRHVRRAAAPPSGAARSPTRRGPSTTSSCAGGSAAHLPGPHVLERPTSTSSATRAGGAGRRPTGRTRTSRARLGVAFVKGLQGDDPALPQARRHPKHFAVHSGPEAAPPPLRRRVERARPARDLPPRVPRLRGGRQGARPSWAPTTATNGEPCCASPTLLEEILRGGVGLRRLRGLGLRRDRRHPRAPHGHQLGRRDRRRWRCDGLRPGVRQRLPRPRARRSARASSRRRRSTGRWRACSMARFTLGMFDPPERVPYAPIPYEVVRLSRAPGARAADGAGSRSCC